MPTCNYALVGIEIPISTLMEKWKVGQNRLMANRGEVALGLGREADHQARHFWGAERGGTKDSGQDARGAPNPTALYNIFNLKPTGRGSGWYPKLAYRDAARKIDASALPHSRHGTALLGMHGTYVARQGPAVAGDVRMQMAALIFAWRTSTRRRAGSASQAEKLLLAQVSGLPHGNVCMQQLVWCQLSRPMPSCPPLSPALMRSQ